MPTDRKLVVTEKVTVDGMIEAAEGWFSPASAGRRLPPALR